MFARTQDWSGVDGLSPQIEAQVQRSTGVCRGVSKGTLGYIELKRIRGQGGAIVASPNPKIPASTDGTVTRLECRLISHALEISRGYWY